MMRPSWLLLSRYGPYILHHYIVSVDCVDACSADMVDMPSLSFNINVYAGNLPLSFYYCPQLCSILCTIMCCSADISG